jgi:hypothetical protein
VFKVCADEFSRHKPGALSSKAHEDIILLTQRGYLRAAPHSRCGSA